MRGSEWPQTSKLVIIVASGPALIASVPATWVGTSTGSRSPCRAALVATRSAKEMRARAATLATGPSRWTSAVR